MTPDRTAPKREIGTVTGYKESNLWPSGGIWGLRGSHWQHLVQENENIPELRYPQNIIVYGRMRNDAQIEALWRGVTLPIRRYNWMVDPNGAREEVVNHVADDYGLQIMDQPPGPRSRSKRRFNMGEHMRLAFLAPLYGHYFFEQVGYIGDDGLWHIRKLAPRRPETISDVEIGDDGGLIAIHQKGTWIDDITIPVNRLVAYQWEMEGAEWFGRSILRSAYQPYLVKDQLLKLLMIRDARNGAGTPIIEGPEDASDPMMEKLNDLALQYKVGEASGGAIPHGARLRLVGVEGSLPDILADIRYQDEALARLLLMMFMQLGTTSYGSRALGDTFTEFFALAQMAVADWFTQTFNEHVIEDDIDWNWGPDEPAPRLVYERNEEPELSMADIAAAVEKNIIIVDDELESFLRKKYRLPSKGDDAPERPPLPDPTAITKALPPGGPPSGGSNGKVAARAHQDPQAPRSPDKETDGRPERVVAAATSGAAPLRFRTRTQRKVAP